MLLWKCVTITVIKFTNLYYMNVFQCHFTNCVVCLFHRTLQWHLHQLFKFRASLTVLRLLHSVFLVNMEIQWENLGTTSCASGSLVKSGLRLPHGFSTMLHLNMKEKMYIQGRVFGKVVSLSTNSGFLSLLTYRTSTVQRMICLQDKTKWSKTSRKSEIFYQEATCRGHKLNF